MVRTNFTITTLASLAFVFGASLVNAQEDPMFSMDDTFSMDDDFNLDTPVAVDSADKTAPVADVKPDTTAKDSVSALEAKKSAPAKTATPAVAPAAAPEATAPAAVAATEGKTDAAENMGSFEEMDIFSQMQTATPETTSAAPSEQLLGAVDSSVFREMAAIERETALLALKAKKEKLLAEIESSKATQRKNQLDELERREQITRGRINWELEQEHAAAKRKAELNPETTAANKINEAPEEDITTLYTIEEVRGVAGDLYAVLLSENGTLNVREGYPLKNGFKVSKVTTSFVEVKRGKEVEMLRFAKKDDISSNQR